MLTVNNIILSGDFNLPSIIWEDGIGQIGANPGSVWQRSK